MLTIEEAIVHHYEKANELRQEAEYMLKDSIDYEPCLECANEHEQLAKWLEELKAYKERPQVVLFAENITEEEKQKLIAEFKAVMDNAKLTVEPDTPEGDLISRSALKEAICKLSNDNPSYYYTGYLLDREKVLDEIDNAPTVEDRYAEGYSDGYLDGMSGADMRGEENE